MSNNFLIYKSEDEKVEINVVFDADNETVWLSQKMQDWAEHLDGILTSTGEQLLQGAESVSHAQAIEKAHDEYRKYQERTLSNVEKDYLNIINMLGKDIGGGQDK